MKKLFAGIITCATILLTGIGISAAAADENNSGDENVQSEIVFVWNSFDECYVGNTDYPPESYKGFFVEKNGNIRSFSFEDVNEHWTFGYVSMEDIPKTISLNQATPQEKLLSHLTDVSKYQIVGKISEKELERNLNLLSDIDTNVNIKMDISPLDIVQGYSETFGLGYDDNGNAEVVFLNGMGTIINKHTDENALEIDSWLRNLDISSDNPNTETTQPNPTENTTTTTVTTTEVKLNTEPSKNENEQSEIVFCVVNSEQTGRTAYSYGGFFIENNGNVRTFSFENIEENFTFNAYWDVFHNAPKSIMLNESIPHDKLLSHLNDNISEYKIVGNISEEEYNSQISLLSEIKVDAEIPFVPFEIAGMTSYTESFGVRYDNDDNAQIVFMNGHVSGDMEYRTYLENPDEKSIELNNWLIEKCKSFMSSEPITTTAPTTPDATTTTTVITTEVKPNTEQTTDPPTTDEGGSVTTETSTVPPTTTTGTETTLPQTGYSKWYQALIAAAMGMIGIGSTAIVRSDIFRKKENNS